MYYSFYNTKYILSTTRYSKYIYYYIQGLMTPGWPPIMPTGAGTGSLNVELGLKSCPSCGTCSSDPLFASSITI